MRLFSYETVERDDEGCPLDAGVLKARNEVEVGRVLRRHLLAQGIDSAEVKVYEYMDVDGPRALPFKGKLTVLVNC